MAKTISRKLKTLLKIFILTGLFINISGCEKTNILRQEALLNTGERIVVNWVVDYSLQGDAGNPMNIKMRPKRLMTLSFEYREKNTDIEGMPAYFY